MPVMMSWGEKPARSAGPSLKVQETMMPSVLRMPAACACSALREPSAAPTRALGMPSLAFLARASAKTALPSRSAVSRVGVRMDTGCEPSI